MPRIVSFIDHNGEEKQGVLRKLCALVSEDDEGTIRRDYMTVQVAGEGAPRDVELTAELRQEYFGAAHAVSTARLSASESARDAWKVEAETLKAEQEELKAEKAALKAAREALES